MTDYTFSKYRKEKKKHGVALILALAGLIATGYSMTYNDTKKPATAQIQCTQCHNRQQAMTNYFRKSGNPTPEEMAMAVLKTKSPRLLAAVAVAGEKNTHYKERAGGYKRQHAGAWQVNKKYWGKVPVKPVDQALQAESILTELTQTMPIKKALNYYGGDTSGDYSRRVLAELQTGGIP